jgi:hypothetical protein
MIDSHHASHRVITTAQVRDVRDSARGDQSLTDACNVVLWYADANGNITELTHSADRVRAVIAARVASGEM